MTKRQPTSAELHERVRQCLLHDWDPIGVRERPEAHDEYDSYVRTVSKLLLNGADAYKLRQHLAQIETVSMGFSTPGKRLDDAVRKLLEIVGR